MAAPPAELISQIAELKEEFQRISVAHPWLCLYVPSLKKGSNAMLFLGQLAASPHSEHEAVFVDPRTGRVQRVHIAWGVDPPCDSARQAVVDHVVQLSHRAWDLLQCVLKFDSNIPEKMRNELPEWEKASPGFGWMHWVRSTTICRCVYRIENYAQRAATALFELKAYCQPANNAAADSGFEGRLRFDQATCTVCFDGKPISVDDPKAYALYKLLVDQHGIPASRQTIRSQNSAFRGDKTVPQLIKKLPPALKKTVQSGASGYWIRLPVRNSK